MKTIRGYNFHHNTQMTSSIYGRVCGINSDLNDPMVSRIGSEMVVLQLVLKGGPDFAKIASKPVL